MSNLERRRIITDDGELDLVQIPDGIAHQDVINSQRKSFVELQKQQAEAMQGHITRLVEVNAKLLGGLFMECGKGKNKMLISKSPVQDNEVIQSYLLVSKFGFLVCRGIGLNERLQKVRKVKVQTQESGLYNIEMVTPENYLFFGESLGEIMRLTTMEDINQEVNKLINGHLNKQEVERAQWEANNKELLKNIENLDSSELNIPEMPISNKSETKPILEKARNLISNIFSKKKRK